MMTPEHVRKLAWMLSAIWASGMIFCIGRLWYFQIIRLNNLAPGKKPRSFFDSSPYNPAGQEAHRKLLNFYWKVLLYGFGGLISIAVLCELLVS
jgi:hypothetical protein